MNSQRELYRADRLPVFQNCMYDSEPAARTAPTGDMLLVEDLRTGLVYNAAFQPELLVYDEHYQNEQAVSPSFRTHLKQVAAIVERTLGKRSLVEVACGKGYFLEMLAARGFAVTGFDPAYEGNSSAVEKRYFDADVGIQAEGLILRHVLEHIDRPVAFLERIRAANGGGGRIYIEVPCFDWICSQGAWYDIFYEHVNYFRSVDFSRMFGTVIEQGHLFGGQYQYVVADLATLVAPQYDPSDAVRFPAIAAMPGHLPEATGKGAVIWGGASKGVIFALRCLREGVPVSAVIDINPAKQGKFLPASGLCVQAPEAVLPHLAPGTTIYVMNSNYLNEIRLQAGSQFNYVSIDQ